MSGRNPRPTHTRAASGRWSVLVRLGVAPARRRGILLRSLFDLRRCRSDNALPYRGRSRGRVYDAVLTFFASSARCSREDFSWTGRAQLPCVLQFDICFPDAEIVSVLFVRLGACHSIFIASHSVRHGLIARQHSRECSARYRYSKSVRLSLADILLQELSSS